MFLTIVQGRQLMACAKALGHDIRNSHQEGKAGAEKKGNDLREVKGTGGQPWDGVWLHLE